MADIDVKMKLVADQFVSGMDKVNKSVSKTNLGIGVLVGNLATKAFSSFASSATKAFSSVFDGAKNLEATTKIFGTLTGSMVEGRKVVNELRQAAASTPFELPGLQKSTQQLLTLNSITSENVVPTLMKLGDVAAVGANDIEGLTNVFVKIQSQGKVTAETFEMLINQSPIMAQAMIEAAGVNGMGALRKAMSEGKITADILDKAIQNVTSEGGKAFNAMGEQSATLGGQMSNLSDTMTNLAGDIGTDLLPVFKDIVSATSEFISENKDLIRSGITTFVTNLKNLWTVMSPALSEVVTLFSDYVSKNREFIGSGVVTLFESLAKVISVLVVPAIKGVMVIMENFIIGPLKKMQEAYEYLKSLLSDSADEHEKSTEKKVKGTQKLSAEEQKAHEERVAREQFEKEQADLASQRKQQKAEEDIERQKILNEELTGLSLAFAEFEQQRRLLTEEYDNASFARRGELLKAWLGEKEAAQVIAEANRLEAIGQHNAAQDLLDQARNDAIKKRLEDEASMREKANKDKEAKQAKHLAEIERQERGSLDIFTQIKQSEIDWEKKTQLEKLNHVSNGLRNITGLMRTENKTMFAIGKATAIATATVDTYASAQKAFTALAGIPVVGPGLATAAAAGAVTAGLARIKSIKAQQPGFEQGGIVPGASFTGDNIGVRVNSSEMILNKQQQTELFRLANGSGGNSGINEALERLGERISNMEIVLVSNDTEIARSASRGVQNGIVIGESR